MAFLKSARKSFRCVQREETHSHSRTHTHPSTQAMLWKVDKERKGGKSRHDNNLDKWIDEMKEQANIRRHKWAQKRKRKWQRNWTQTKQTKFLKLASLQKRDSERKRSFRVSNTHTHTHTHTPIPTHAPSGHERRVSGGDLFKNANWAGQWKEHNVKNWSKVCTSEKKAWEISAK